MAKAKTIHGNYLKFECPACGHPHLVAFAPAENYTGPVWGWNNSTEAPTITPSVRVTWNEPEMSSEVNDEEYGVVFCQCHFFVVDGEIQYCGDCTHELAGKNIVLPEIE